MRPRSLLPTLSLFSLSVFVQATLEERPRFLQARADCIDADPQSNVTERLNSALSSNGDGYILSLCPNAMYNITAPIMFTHPNQEISTAGYPTDDTRATLVVSGVVFQNLTGHTNAVDGTCNTCDGVRLRNIQIDGQRGNHSMNGGANIEMGGSNSGQLIEYVHSHHPRSWSCLHIAEGGKLDCTNVTVQFNDIGPCGVEDFQQWSDGISFSCQNGLVQSNMINNPTDGGIVLFGSPGTIVQNNSIWIEEQTLLGGINLVDFEPWKGNYTDVVVRDNTIYGGFATDANNGSTTDGEDKFDAIIKIGIAIGPRTWFGDRYLNNKSMNATVINNRLTGAFGYAMAISSAKNFTVEGNELFGNTSFIGSRGPNCSSTDNTPSTRDFVLDTNTTVASTTQSNFQVVSDGDSLTCILPPDGGDYWPYGGNPETTTQSESSSLSAGAKAGLALGIIFGILAIAVLAWFIRKKALARQLARENDAMNRKGFVKSI